MAPVRSYIIWFSQRVGSTLLTNALEDTGVAGRPREWFNALPEHLEAGQLRDTLWRDGTTPNGVCGVKYGMTRALHARLTALFGALAGTADERAAWEAVLPQCRHIFMMRRNRVRLAVSWWRAITSGEWHRPTRDDTVVGRRVERPAAAVDDRYDAAALDHLLAEASFREAAIQDVFDRWAITPLTIAYEDLVSDFPGTVCEVLDFLKLGAGVAVPEPAFARIADDVAERWYHRFTADAKTRSP